MRGIAWISLLPLIIVTSLIIYDEWVSTPSCKIMPSADPNDYEPGPNSGSGVDLKVMMVANLLLVGSDSGFVDRHFRDYYMAKFFRVSWQICLYINIFICKEALFALISHFIL